MTPEEYRHLYQQIRKYQLEDTRISGKSYSACDVLLQELFPYSYTQKQEQCR